MITLSLTMIYVIRSLYVDFPYHMLLRSVLKITFHSQIAPDRMLLGYTFTQYFVERPN